MDDSIKEAFLEYAETDYFLQKVEEAKKIISNATKKYRTYVAFSGGKDSLVCLHIALQKQKDIMVLHWDYGRYYMPETFLDEIKAAARTIGATNFRIYSSKKYDELKRNADNVWGKEFFKNVVPQLRKEGFGAVIVGLRKEESIARRNTVSKGRAIGGIKEIYPVGDWSYRDIWAYILKNKLPYHSTYDKYGPVVGWDKIRFVTFFDPQFDFLGNPNIDGVLNWRWKNE